MTTQHQLFSDTRLDSEIAKCFTCPYGTQKFSGGANMQHVTVNAEKNGKKFKMDIWYNSEGQYQLHSKNLGTNRTRKSNHNGINELKRELEKYTVDNYEIKKIGHKK